jgi:two-component system CheB/CheR fusion protein
LRTPVDAFFRSLASDQGERAIGIVLSGAGSDGTAGLRMIKEHGGLTVAQAPETAKFDSMPQSAIAAGLVDFVLTLDEMPGRLIGYAHRIAKVQREGAANLEAELTTHLPAICEVVQRLTGHDFSRYKHGTLLRRIRRRIQLQQLDSVSDYLKYLQTDVDEAERLHRDLLIGVTSLFRDPEVFSFLAAEIIPGIIDIDIDIDIDMDMDIDRGSGGPVRFWIPGCASGEEAYSLAILVREHLSRVGSSRPVQIFATDIDSEQLITARLGRYSAKIAENVSPERLERFFTPVEDGYQIAKELRAMCTFSEHSLIRDPPFSSLDLISCRNLLIYLGAELQRKLVPLFHYALRPGGVLLLGPSESLAANPELFITLDKKLRIFRRSEVAVRPPLEFPLAGRTTQRPPLTRLEEDADLGSSQGFSHAFERMILEEYAPPSAVTNEQGDILYVAGRTGRYLQVAAGAPSNNIFDLAQGLLRIELRNVLDKAVATRRKVVRHDVVVELEGRSEHLRLTARPLPGVHPESGLFTIVLQGMGATGELADDDGAGLSVEQPAIEQLENELRNTRASLQSAMQDLESANEELKSSNEELISTNEELQSANEELQTSKEELQATNDELRSKVLELDAANSDLQYHFAGTNIITVFLDRELRILRCTPAASKLFHVLDGDLRRPFRDLAPRFVEEDIMADITAALEGERTVERYVHRSDDASWYLVRILPYRAQDQPQGVGVTFVDVSDLAWAQESERRYGRLLQLSPDAITVWHLDGGIETWNRGAEELYGYSADEARGRSPRELLDPRFEQAWSEVEAFLRHEGRWEGELQARTKDGRTVTVSSRLVLMTGEDRIRRILQSDRDISDKKAAEVESRRRIRALSEAEDNKNQFLAMLSHELRNPLTPIRNSLFILDHAEASSQQAQRAKAVIVRQVAQLSRMVEDLLDVTRISRGKLQVQRTGVELGELVRRTAEDHRSVIVQSGLDLELRMPDHAMWVQGDPARLSQAIGNLLQNAAKFTARGGHVMMALEEDIGSGRAIVRVRDDGAGLGPELLERLFQPFAQADSTLDRTRGGLGLGLALTKGLVEEHGGTIRVSSDGPGKGSEFTIVLPLGEPPTDTESSAPHGLPHPRRVLVIEDNLDAAESLREALQLSRHAVEVAYNGTEGLNKAKVFKPDVILCDIGLPGMDGYEVARTVRADPDLHSIYLVALTGYALPEDLARARRAGFEQHLAKPPSMDRIETVLAEAATRGSREPALNSPAH